MGDINFYFIHFNPCLIYFSEEKSRIINEIFENYKEKIDTTATLGEVRLFSFAPKSAESYSDILECYLPYMKGPCVLVCYSIYDLAASNFAGYGRIAYALTSDKIKTLYFYNYNPKEDVNSYFDTLMEIFRFSTNPYEKPGSFTKRPKAILDNDDIISDIMQLRTCSPPVKYEDLARVSGINDSTLRKKGRFYDNSNSKGVDISQPQEDYIRDLVKKSYAKNMKKYRTIEETFHP